MISTNALLLLVFGLVLLGTGIVLPWLIGGMGIAIVAFGPLDNSWLGTLVRENSLLGFVAMLSLLVALIMGPLAILEASIAELRNFVFGITLGGSLLVAATILYMHWSAIEN